MPALGLTGSATTSSFTRSDGNHWSSAAGGPTLAVQFGLGGGLRLLIDAV